MKPRDRDKLRAAGKRAIAKHPRIMAALADAPRKHIRRDDRRTLCGRWIRSPYCDRPCDNPKCVLPLTEDLQELNLCRTCRSVATMCPVCHSDACEGCP